MSDDQTMTPPAPAQAPIGWKQPTPEGSTGFNFSDFLNFRYLITPAFVTVIYVLGAVGITVGSLVSMTQSVITGLLLFIFGNLYWRILLEFIMVLFRMNDSLKSIDRRGKGM